MRHSGRTEVFTGTGAAEAEPFACVYVHDRTGDSRPETAEDLDQGVRDFDVMAARHQVGEWSGPVR